MGSILLDKLTKSLDKALVEAGPQPLETFGFYDPEEGKGFEDLKWVRGPATSSPIDVRQWIVEEPDGTRIRFEDEKEARTYASHLAGSHVIHKPEGEVVGTWTQREVMNALRPAIIKAAKKYSSGAWSKRPYGEMDQHAFGDLVNNALFAVWYALARGDDQKRMGNSFLSWINRRIKAAARAGTGLGTGREDRNTLGYLNQLLDVQTASETANLVGQIPPEFRKTAGLTVGKVNKFGRFAPILFDLATDLQRALRFGTQEEIDVVKDKIEDRHAKIRENMETRIQAASTGLLDPFDFPHSDTNLSRYLERLLDTENLEKLSDIVKETPGRIADQRTYKDSERKAKKVAPLKLAKELLSAVEAGDDTRYQEVRQKIENVIKDIGGRETFRRRHKIEPMQVPGEGGEMIEHPGTPTVKDKFIDAIQDKEIATEILEAAFDGIKTPQGIVRLTEVEQRIIIRLFGLSDYPTRGEIERDIEFNPERYHEIRDRLSNGLVVEIEPVDEKEAGKIAEVASQTEVEFSRLIGTYRKTKKLLVTAEGKDAADEIATILGYSNWVRMGCPELTATQVRSELGLYRPGTKIEISNERLSQMKGKMIGKLQQVAQSIGVLESTNEDPLLTALLKTYECVNAIRHQLLMAEGIDNNADYPIVVYIQKQFETAILNLLMQDET